MEQTQRFDPNNMPDSNRTQAMTGQPPSGDRTQAMTGAGGRALGLNLIPGRQFSGANTAAREGFLIEITASANAMSRERLPLNICLLIDRSGSMEGEPLTYAKQACGYVVDLLTDQDVLSVVTFEDSVDLIMPPRRVVNKQLIKEHIQRIEVGDTTNLHGGLSMGVQQLLSIPSAGMLTRLVLLTDGDPTSGIKDFNSIVSVVTSAKDRGVSCTALGFGPEYNEELLAALARRSGGNYYFIQRPELIPEVFRKELERLMTVAGRNLKLKIDLARWVQVRQIFGHQVPPTGRTIELNLVDVERGSLVNVVGELEFPNHPAGNFRVGKVTLSYEDSATGQTETITENLVLEFTEDSSKLNSQQNPRVSQEILVSQASKQIERTVMGMKTQQLSAATMMLELQKTQQLLTAQGRITEAQDVSQAIRDIQRGDIGQVEKTLIGTQINLERGKNAQ